MKNTIFNVILLCFFYLLIILYDNKENVYHLVLSCITARELISVPTNPTLLGNINLILDKNIRNRSQYTFIDFGSGFGTLLEQMRDKHVKLIGVELEASSNNEACLKLRMYENITLENKSMQDFIFPDEATILYMYEPLFLESDCNKRTEIYNQVISNMKSSKKAFVMYVQEIRDLRKGCEFDFKMFKNHGFTLKDVVSSNLWPLSRKGYLFER